MLFTSPKTYYLFISPAISPSPAPVPESRGNPEAHSAPGPPQTLPYNPSVGLPPHMPAGPPSHIGPFRSIRTPESHSSHIGSIIFVDLLLLPYLSLYFKGAKIRINEREIRSLLHYFSLRVQVSSRFTSKIVKTKMRRLSQALAFCYKIQIQLNEIYL